MKILLLGTTGRTGQLFLQEALKAGHSINAIVRDRSKIEAEHENLFLFDGVPTDSEVLANAMNGCDAVVCLLNVSRTSDFPWAKLRSPKDLISGTMKQVVKIANEFKIKRVVTCSAWGVNETQKDLPGWLRWILRNSNIGVAYQDHERQENILMASPLDWTIVRPVGMTSDLKDKDILVSIDNDPKPNMTINRLSVAKFMLQELESGKFIKQAPVISNK